MISFYDPTGTHPLTNINVRYNLILFDKNSHAAFFILSVIPRKRIIASIDATL